jgi:hypothetical protein
VIAPSTNTIVQPDFVALLTLIGHVVPDL